MKPSAATVVVLMGVSGAGKTTVGEALSARLRWRFVDADALHPPENVRKMAAGKTLTDADRAPWLEKVAAVIRDALATGSPLVVACSALKARYRQVLGVDDPRVRLVSLEGDPALLASRLNQRTHAFMPPSLLASQLAAFEPPEHVLRIDVSQSVQAIVEAIRTSVTSQR